ncbi:polycystin-2-like protein 2 [Pelodytes ibericus]
MHKQDTKKGHWNMFGHKGSTGKVFGDKYGSGNGVWAQVWHNMVLGHKDGSGMVFGQKGGTVKVFENTYVPRMVFGLNNAAGKAEKSESTSMGFQFKTAQHELLTFIIFLVLICTLSFAMISQDMYHLNNAMEKLFLETSYPENNNNNFMSINTIVDFWKFAEGPLLEGLYWTKWYNNGATGGDKSFVYYENILLGLPQIRQLKVRADTCKVHSYFNKTIKDCFSAYHFSYEDTGEFGLKNSSEWRYTVPQYLQWHWGNMGVYSSGGYIATLSQTKENSRSTIEYLKRNNWLTRGSRVVFIDFSLYNPNVNLFCVSRLVVEFPATGGAIPSWKFYAVKLLRYISDTDYFVAVCEVLFCLVICVCIYQEVISIKKFKVEYFKYFWNWLDISLIAVSLLAIGFNIYRTAQVSMLLEKLLEDSNIYPDLHFLAYCQIHYNNMVAVTVFFAWMKIFKFITFNKTMNQLSTTLSRCAKNILGFAIMFFIVFFSYAQFGFLIFGAQVAGFSSFADCIFTQFRIILGDFNFADIEKADRILGPLYFITFIFFVFFVLLNMFVAIINDTYSEVKSEFSGTDSDVYVWEIIQENYHKALNKIKLRKNSEEEKEHDSAEKVISSSKHEDMNE